MAKTNIKEQKNQSVDTKTLSPLGAIAVTVITLAIILAMQSNAPTTEPAQQKQKTERPTTTTTDTAHTNNFYMTKPTHTR